MAPGLFLALRAVNAVGFVQLPCSVSQTVPLLEELYNLMELLDPARLDLRIVDVA